MSVAELWELHKDTPDDSVQVYALSTLATNYTRINPDSAILLAKAALEGAQKGRFSKLEGEAYTSLGEAYDVSGKIALSLENFGKGLAIFEQLKNEEGIARVHNSRGLAFFYSGQLNEALADLLIAKDFFEKQRDPAKIARNYHNLGLTYSTLNEAYPALRYYLRARNMKDSLINIGHPEINVQEQLSTYINLGAFYTHLRQFDKGRESLNTALDIATDEQLVRRMGIFYNLGTIEELDSNFVKADSLYRISLDLALQGNMIPRQPYIYDALGNVARKQRSTEQAATFYQQAFLILEDVNMPDIRSGLLIDQGNLFLDQGDITNARANAEDGLLIAEENNIRQQKIDGYELMAKTAEELGNPTEAAQYLRKYIDLKEVADYESKQQELIGLQAVFDVEMADQRHAQELAQLERDQYLYWIKWLIAALLAIAILAMALAMARRSLATKNYELNISNSMLSEKTIELATSNQQLNIANNKLQQFAFATGHDLKESLRNITSFTQLASIEMAEDLGNAQAHLKEAAAGGKRMRKMLDDLLHYSNLGGNETVAAAFPLQEIVSSVKQQLKTDILATQGDVHLATPASLKANRNEIEQLFINLIDNSLRYRQPAVPPRVQIKLEKRDEAIVFMIKDNGMGIPKEERTAVFKPFHRLHNRMQSGSGLGLSICQRVVESYGGEIWYEAAENGGAVFCFTLPNAQPKGQF